MFIVHRRYIRPLVGFWINLAMISTITLGLTVGCSSPTAPAVGILLVTVLDEIESPVSGVSVTVTEEDLTQITDSDGRVLFLELPPGSHLLHIVASSIGECLSRVSVTSGDTTYHEIVATRRRGMLIVYVKERWTKKPLQLMPVRVLCQYNEAILAQDVTDSQGEIRFPLLPAREVIVTTDGAYPFFGAMVDTSLIVERIVRVNLALDRAFTEYYGALQYSSESHTSTGNSVGILCSMDGDGPFNSVLDPIPFTSSYRVSTDQNGYLAAVALGNDTPYEFALTATPVYDCTGGHLSANHSLIGWISRADPRDFTAHATQYTPLHIFCAKSVGAAYTEFQIFRWYQIAEGDWEYELVWYSGYVGGANSVGWMMRYKDSRKVPASPEGVPYSWICIDILNDGTSRITQDYFFLITSTVSVNKRRINFPEPALATASRESVFDRYRAAMQRLEPITAKR